MHIKGLVNTKEKKLAIKIAAAIVSMGAIIMGFKACNNGKKSSVAEPAITTSADDRDFEKDPEPDPIPKPEQVKEKVEEKEEDPELKIKTQFDLTVVGQPSFEPGNGVTTVAIPCMHHNASGTIYFAYSDADMSNPDVAHKIKDLQEMAKLEQDDFKTGKYSITVDADMNVAVNETTKCFGAIGYVKGCLEAENNMEQGSLDLNEYTIIETTSDGNLKACLVSTNMPGIDYNSLDPNQHIVTDFGGDGLVTIEEKQAAYDKEANTKDEVGAEKNEEQTNDIADKKEEERNKETKDVDKENEDKKSTSPKLPTQEEQEQTSEEKKAAEEAKKQAEEEKKKAEAEAEKQKQKEKEAHEEAEDKTKTTDEEDTNKDGQIDKEDVKNKVKDMFKPGFNFDNATKDEKPETSEEKTVDDSSDAAAAVEETSEADLADVELD